MPTYEYECRHCKHGFEVFQSMKDKALQRCPKCKHKIKRVPGTGAGIIFKGSGFYQTDYRSSNYRENRKKEKSAETETKKESGDAKGSGKTDAAGKSKSG